MATRSPKSPLPPDRSREASGAHLSPELKAFLDDVVVPALVQRWEREHAQKVKKAS